MTLPLCAVKWCLSSVAPGKDLCAIHGRFGRDYRAVTETKHCKTCDDTRACDECDGSGECDQCHCGTTHDCGMCDGTGHCPDCHEQAPPQLEPTEQDYVRWALSDGLEPCLPFFSGMRVREDAR
jgi:hypothetical protein